jgi:SAM-dependent methyltransferase
MRNKERWAPSKYVYKRGKLVASRDRKEVGISSRLIVDLIAASYDQYLATYARGKLIDLGCGKVPLFEAYRNYAAINICIDWGNSLHGNAHLDAACDLTKDLPFRDSEFDTVILADVLEHIPQPEQIWKEMSRILTDRGRLLISVPFYYPVHEAPHDYFRYTEFALRRLAESWGFTVLVLEPMGGVPAILADVLAKNLLIVPKVGAYPAIILQHLTTLFLNTRLGRKISRVTSAAFPIEYFLVAERVRDRANGL